MIVIGVVLLASLLYPAVGGYGLHLTCDGLVILDSPIIFSAFLNTDTPDASYIYLFKDNVKPSSVWLKKSNARANLTVVYTDRVHKPGNYTMKVAVSDGTKIVALGEVPFTITDCIPVNLTFSQGGKYDKDVEFLLTNREVSMVVSIPHLQNYFSNATVLYTWEVGSYRISTLKHIFNYNFTHPGSFEVTATVFAKVILLHGSLETNRTRFGYKWGFSKEIVTVKDPITTVNVTGQTWLPHGQVLDLNVFCTGSGPYVYCWKIFPHGDDQNHNVTCLEPVVTNDCSFPIIHYFPQPGSYHVGIHINNFVDFHWKNMKIFVYDVSHKPQLSVVILPLVCTILAVIIVAGGVIYYLQSRRKVYIEIADFDFLQSSNNSIGYSVWEQMFISIRSKIFYSSIARTMLSGDENYRSIE